ncbi:MAG: GNAT family N-acetyltransferase [Saprospiraceae bacterium]|nr:GNAT family N-acetyltransferase [Saprospiraceae bacterium]
MKIFFSESKPEYKTYTFNYGIYCIKEDNKELTTIYEKGFLPYSGNTELQAEIFYLARSLRVDLDRFVDSSENRRVNRKIEPLNIKVEFLSKNDVLSDDPGFHPFCEQYVSARIGEAMTPSRLQYILDLTTGTHVFRFTRDDHVVGYVLAVVSLEIVHYWFSFFDLELMRSHSLGKWMMWSVIQWAKSANKKSVYLGTAYGEKALYKVRDHKGLSFFDGSSWNEDMDLLKSWCKTDQDRDATDRFKLAEDANLYIQNIFP